MLSFSGADDTDYHTLIVIYRIGLNMARVDYINYTEP